MNTPRKWTLCLLLSAAWLPTVGRAEEVPFTVDKDKKTITIPCKIAPRKLPNLDQVYPIEVVAGFAAPKGQKAHETVVTLTAKPSEIHKALEDLGLKAGTPAKGEGAAAQGPEVKISIDLGDKIVPIEKCLVDKKTGKTMPTLKWLFTGSKMTQPDPEKPDKVYAADLTGTLIAVFPVTDETVFQSNLTMKDEPILKMETNKDTLPEEGKSVNVIIEVK